MHPAGSINPIPFSSRRSGPYGLAGAIVLAACLGACTRHGDADKPQAPARPAAAATGVTVPKEFHDKEWMAAIFGQDYRPDSASALRPDTGQGFVVMTFVSAAMLPDGRLVVVVNGSPAEEDGDVIGGYADPGIVNAYVLRRGNRGWEVLARYEHIAETGVRGNIGGVDWIMLGAGKPGFTLTSVMTLQGHTSASAEIFGLDGGARRLGSVTTLSSNAEACPLEDGDCWEIGAEIRFEAAAQANGYADMLVDYNGKHYRVSEGKDGKQVEHLTSTVKQTARWRFDGKEYVLVSGTDPMPEI